MDKRKLVIKVLLEGNELTMKEITEKISEDSGESFQVRDFSALLTRMSNEKLCDLGHFVNKTKHGNRFAYKMVDEATVLSIDQAYGLFAKDGDYNLARALNDFPKLRKYAAGGDHSKSQAAEPDTQASAGASESKETNRNIGGDQQDINTPIYVSTPSGKNFWQEYRVYPDRVELDCKLLFQTITIPAKEIVDIESRPPLAFLDIFRGKGIKQAFAFKFDGADLNQHVVIERKSGIMKCIRFTPDDPEKFIGACKSTLK